MTNKILIILFFIFIIMQGSLLAQKTSDLNGSVSTLVQILGPELLGGYFNVNVNKRISVNAGLGVNLDAHLGSNVYLTNRINSLSALYTGVQLIYLREFTLIDICFYGSCSSGNPETQIGTYIPFGFEYIARRGFTIQLEAGLNFVQEDWGQRNTAPFLWLLRIGHTFK